jgi:iron-regulated transporter 1
MVPRITLQRPSVSSNGSYVAWNGMGNEWDASGGRRADAEWDADGVERGSQDSYEEGSVKSFVIERRNKGGGERAKWWKVYALHLLFMWNSRTYEYVSVSYYLPTYLSGLF